MTATRPKRKINWAVVVAAPGAISFRKEHWTTLSNFFSRPSKYSSSREHDFNSCIVSRYSCTPSYAALLASIFAFSALDWAFFAAKTTSAATGTGSTMQSPILQSMTKSPIAVIINIKIVPKSWGMALENTRSSAVQSPIIVVVRSERSLWPKKDNGNFLNFSARTIRRLALSS